MKIKKITLGKSISGNTGCTNGNHDVPVIIEFDNGQKWEDFTCGCADGCNGTFPYRHLLHEICLMIGRKIGAHFPNDIWFETGIFHSGALDFRDMDDFTTFLHPGEGITQPVGYPYLTANMVHDWTKNSDSWPDGQSCNFDLYGVDCTLRKDTKASRPYEISIEDPMVAKSFRFFDVSTAIRYMFWLYGDEPYKKYSCLEDVLENEPWFKDQ